MFDIFFNLRWNAFGFCVESCSRGYNSTYKSFRLRWQVSIDFWNVHHVFHLFNDGFFSSINDDSDVNLTNEGEHKRMRIRIRRVLQRAKSRLHQQKDVMYRLYMYTLYQYTQLYTLSVIMFQCLWFQILLVHYWVAPDLTQSY